MIIPVTDVDSVWPQASAQLERVIHHSQGDFDLQDIYNRLRSGIYILWLVNNKGWAVSLNSRRKRGNVFSIVALAGKAVLQDLKDDEAFMRYIKDRFNIVQLEAMCRPSMVRLVKRYGWKPKYQVVTLDLGD